MRLHTTLLYATLSALSAWSLTAAEAGKTTGNHTHLMAIVSKGLPGVVIYDADTEQVVCKATTGVAPHEAAFSRDGRMVYVPVYGSTAVGAAGTNEHVLHFIRTSDCHDMKALDTGDNKRPHGIAVGNGGTIYLTAEVAKSLLLIDPKTQEIVGKIPTGSEFSHMIAVMPDEKTIFVSNVGSKTISVLDVPDQKLAQEIPTPTTNQRMTLSPDFKWFVTNYGPLHQVAFYRTADHQLDFTIPIDGDPFVARFSKDGRYLYDAGHPNGKITVWKIDVASRKVVATSNADLGSATGSLEISPFTGTIYVTDNETSRLTELDPETLAVKKQVGTEKTPDCIIFASVK
jgi:DNA-binding beta-propeller fold protein YncE